MPKYIGNPPNNSPALMGLEEKFGDVWQRWFANLSVFSNGFLSVSSAIDPASVAANTVSRQTFTVSGLLVDDNVTVNPPALPAGLEIISSRVSAANTLQITFWNTTGAPINAGEDTYIILAVHK